MKRKEPDSDGRAETTSPPTSDATSQDGEYQNGHVICEVCGVGISFRDEGTDRFTVEHWNSHRLVWQAILLSPYIFSNNYSTLVSALAFPLASQRALRITIYPLSHFLFPNADALSVLKKSGSSTCGRIHMSPSLKHTVYFALLVISGYAFVPIRRIAPFPGTLIGRAVSRGRCMFSSVSI